MPARTRAPLARTASETFLPTLPERVAAIFEQAQTSRASWTKNFVALHKLHGAAAAVTEDAGNGHVKVVGLRRFEDAVYLCLNEVLVNKKGVTVADRAVGFVAGYVQWLVTKAAEDEEAVQLSEWFAPRLLRHILPGLSAKSVPARFRATQLIAHLVAVIDSLDEELCDELREAVVERINDKEASIRVQAVFALVKVGADEHLVEEPALGEDELTMVEILEDVMACDVSPDVRRAALSNMPIIATTLPAIITRTRDADTATRRTVYQGVLLQNIAPPNEPDTLGPTHPRVLSIAQREEILRAGLADREASVREVAATLVRAWVVALGGAARAQVKEEEPAPDAPAVDPAQLAADGEVAELCAFLDTFDLAAGSTDVAASALLSVFATDKNRVKTLARAFPAQFWTSLTPARVFLARVYAEHCAAEKDLENVLEECLPAVTALAFHLQAAYNGILALPAARPLAERDGDEDEDDADADFARENGLFIAKELLRVAKAVDYQDEAGRRRMFKLVRDLVAREDLPDELLVPALDVLRLLCGGEGDLILIVVGIIVDLRDGAQVAVDGGTDEDGEAVVTYKAREEMSSDEKARADAVDVRCLDLFIGMLERINGTFDEHVSLTGLVADFVVPSVRRKELAFREKGLHCLGLVTLISPSMAANARQLFQQHLAPQREGQAPPLPAIKLRLLEIIVDVVMVHAQRLDTARDGGRAIAYFIHAFTDEDEHPDVQAKAVIGLVKLVFAGMVTEPKILAELWLLYISPHTRENHALRQCLAYFFDKYPLASARGQRRMASIFLPVYRQLVWAHRAYAAQSESDDEDDAERRAAKREARALVALPTFVDMFVNFVNPAPARGVPGRGGPGDEDVHIELAIDVLKELLHPTKFGHGLDAEAGELTESLEKADRKVLCNVFKPDKLHLPADGDENAVRALKLLSAQAVSRRPVKDPTAANVLAKFDARLDKEYGDAQLDGFSEGDARALDALADLFAFLDELIPLDEDEEEFPIEPRARGRPKKNARAASVATTTDEESDATVTGARAKGKKKAGTPAAAGRAKRRRLSADDDEDAGSDEDEGTPRGSATPSAAPTRSMPRRAATRKVDMTPVKLEGIDEDDDEDEDDDDDDDDDVEATPVPKRRAPPPSKARSRKPAAATDDEESGAEGNPVLVPNSSDDDAEVFDLLQDDDDDDDDDDE